MQRTSAPSSPFRAPPEYTAVDRRTIGICAGAVVVAIGAGLAAQLLIRLIGFVTNATFYGRLSTAFVAPLGAKDDKAVVEALNRHAKFIRGRMSPALRQMKYMPEFRFRLDTSYDNFRKINDLLHSPAVARDLGHDAEDKD